MAKNIVLCSDGTGKRGGSGNDTNVYKLYRAVDIHNSKQPQVTFYENGVGTNVDGEALKQNKFWRALSGAFGFGFEQHVRDMYEYLVMNYQPGDRIYLCGFSRGASIVRAFAGMLHTCGLLNIYDASGNRKNRREIQKLIDQAILAYRKRRKDAAIAEAYKREHAVKDDEFAPEGSLKIHFIGVWDTVSALGFPQDWSILINKSFAFLDKLTEEIWPHHYYNFRLNDDIAYACQALAIDDQRETFFPRVWREQGRTDGSVEQVWFTGVHSNVGGGYPRSGLSNVGLEWMMQRAKKHGVVFIDDALKDAHDYANVHGKLYDSRDGIAIYYRYLPRDIETICEQRLNDKVKIHDTVMARIKRGTASYAPGFLPQEFDVVDTAGKKISSIRQDPGAYGQNRKAVLVQVNRLRWLYRIFVESTVILLAIIIGFWVNPPDSILSAAGSCEAFFLFSWIHALLTYILPGMFGNFLTYILCVHAWIFVVMLAIAYAMFRYRKTCRIALSRALMNTRDEILQYWK